MLVGVMRACFLYNVLAVGARQAPEAFPGGVAGVVADITALAKQAGLSPGGTDSGVLEELTRAAASGAYS